MCTIDAVEQSTYRRSYRGEIPSLRMIKYKDIPSIYVNLTNDSDRSFKIPPTRAKRPAPQPPKVATDHATSLNTVRPKSSTKPTSTNVKVFNTKFGPMDSATVDALYNKRRYSTFTQSAGQEFALPFSRPDPPKTTQEPKADMVRLRGQRYEETADRWQDAALWDRIQSRAVTQGSDTSVTCKTLPIPPSERSGDNKPLQKRHVTCSVDQSKQEKITRLVKSDGLANVFTRKCPGYAGYTPLCPPETRLDDKKSQAEVTSLMTSSYSKFPDSIYKQPTNAKKGIFSKMVTLTSPLNPYNKVGEGQLKVDKESRYLNMKDYLNVLPY